MLNERRQNYENRPYGFAGMAIASALYPPDHPYHWLTIGSAEDIQAASLEDARAFFQKYYHPGNASLALAGAIDTDEALALARKYFEELPAGPAVAPVVARDSAAGRGDPAASTKIGSSCRGSISPGARRRCSPMATRPMM